MPSWLAPNLRKDFKVVIVCIITAATFWFFNALNKTYTTTLSYPVEIDYGVDSLMLTGELPEVLLAEVEGGGWGLMRYRYVLDPVRLSLTEPFSKPFFTREELAA